MSEQRSKVVPGIPLAALDSISDTNVKAVLKALIDAHHVRNGNIGSGEERFVTAKEIGLLGNGSIYKSGMPNVQQGQQGNGNTLTPGQVGRIINDLTAEIIESPLFKELGARIDLIDAPDGLVVKFNVLKDGVTNLTTVTNNTVTTVQGIQATVYSPTTGLAAVQAKIGEINNVDVNSSSASAQKLALVRSAVFDQNSGLARAVANILEEKTTRVNSDNAIARAVNTIWAAVGDNQSLIQEGAESVTNNAGANAQKWSQLQATVKDPVTGQYISSAALRTDASTALNKAGLLEAKYTVKIDLNGYVSGFGLASTQNNQGALSEFYIRADRFAIGSPNVNRPMNPDGSFPPADPINIPFIVTTTGRYVNGIYSPPGTYIKNAFIENGTITKVQIGLAEIDTLRVAGNAIVVPSMAVASAGVSVTNAWSTILTAYVDYGDNAPSLVQCMATVNVIALTSGTASSISVRICQDGVPGPMICSISLPGGFSGVASLSDAFTCSKGAHSYQVQIYQAQGSTAYQAQSRNITIMGAKR